MGFFWDRVSGVYDLSQLLNRNVNRTAAELAAKEIPAGGRVLDCGAGTGMFTVAAAPRAHTVVCTDRSAGMLKKARQKAWKAGLHNISFSRRSIYRLKDADNTYDAVIAGNVVHLIDRPEIAVGELIRVTKKGGKIIIPTFLAKESLMGRMLSSLYKKSGFAPKTDYSMDTYMQFIARTAQENGCTRYRTQLIRGILPAAFAVIIK